VEIQRSIISAQINFNLALNACLYVGYSYNKSKICIVSQQFISGRERKSDTGYHNKKSTLNQLQFGQRIKTRRSSTQPKKRNRCHAMVRHQNADAMVLASALMRGPPPPPPLDVPHFEYYQGVNASHKRTG
jgi:hypothetical protein